jgi:hypothetical protein
VLAQDHVYALLPAAQNLDDLVLLQDMHALIVDAQPVATFEHDIASRLQGLGRVWLVRYDGRPSNNDPAFTTLLEREGFCLARSFDAVNSDVELFARCATMDS